MKEHNRIQQTIDILDELLPIKKPADRMLDQYFRARRYIGAKDRTFLKELVYDILRHFRTIEWHYQQVNPEPLRARSLVIVGLLLLRDKTYTELKDIFNGETAYSPKPFSRYEHEWVKRIKKQIPEETRIRLNVPDVFFHRLKASLGESYVQELEALLDKPEVNLRVNRRKASREDAQKLLEKEGVRVSLCHYAPFGLKCASRFTLANMQAYQKGVVEVQDEGSQLISLLVDANKTHKIVDFCAGAGGKTLAIADSMEHKGRITACDVVAPRLEGIVKRLKRADIHNVTVKLLSSEQDPWVKKHQMQFDRVLLDVPCTGVGAWRRNPDAKWQFDETDIQELQEKQARILKSASRLVKPEGRLIYATCSLLEEENAQQIERFLAEHNGFDVISYKDIWAEVIKTPLPCEGPYLQLTPYRHSTDGFFCAILKRK